MIELYEINKQLQEAYESAVDPETGEILSDEALDRISTLEMARDEKIESVGLWIKNLAAEAAAIKAEKLELAKRQASAEKRAENLKKYLSEVLAGEKFKTARLSISWRKSEAVKVADDCFLPDEYLTFKEPAPNLTALKAALKAGETIPGASIVSSNNIQIK